MSMKHIQFYGYDLEKMDSAALDRLFERIKEEIEYHKFSNKVYPQKIHVYRHYIEFMGDKNPDSHLVIHF